MMSKRLLVTFFSRFFLTPHACFILMSCNWSSRPSLAGVKMGRVARQDETYIKKCRRMHHAGFLLLCVCVMLILMTDIHLLSVPHAGPLTRTPIAVVAVRFLGGEEEEEVACV